MFKATIRGLLAHKLRLLLTALAIVLGVSFISGTYVLTDTMGAAFDNLFRESSAGVDVYVRDASDFESQFGGSRQPISAAVLEEVRQVEGVRLAEGSVEGYAQMIDKGGEAITPGGPPTLGFNWVTGEMNPLRLRDGAPPRGPDDVVIDANTADRYDFAVGDPIDVITLAEPRTFTVAGIATFGDEKSLAGATLALFETSTAQRLFDKKGKFDSLEIAAEDGVSELELRNRIRAILPRGLEAQTAASVAEETSGAIQEGLGFFNTALLVFAGVALFVGSFLIFNTFSITVAQRTREFALLRALGASGRQVMGSVIVEALIVGLFAAAVGLGLGLLIAQGLYGLLEAFGINLPQGELQLTTRTIVVALVVGVLVTLLSAILPARRAARISPMAALRESGPLTYTLSRTRVILGTLITLTGGILLFAGLNLELDREIAYVGAGAAVIFLGVAALAPVFARPLARGIGGFIARVMHVPGLLAQKNASRNPKRTASTAAALMIGLALVGFVGIFGDSSKTSTAAVLDKTMRADFTIQTTSFASQVISPKLGQQLAERDELAAVTPFRFGQFRHDGANLFVVATDPTTLPQTAEIEAKAGDLAELQDGGVFLFDSTARDLGLAVGDTYEMQFAATGKQDMEVVGIFGDKTLVGSDYLISIETYDENITQPTDTNIFIKAASGVPLEEARTVIEEIAVGYPNVEVTNQAEAKETYAGQIDQLLGLVTALLALALVIALLGITNTLALSVYERTRELGLLRAVGMSRKQTRAMIRWEAVIIVIIGGLLGLSIGVFFGWALVRALAEEGITEFTIPEGQLLVYLLLAVLAGVVAAIPPARRAAKLNVLEAIATE